MIAKRQLLVLDGLVASCGSPEARKRMETERKAAFIDIFECTRHESSVPTILPSVLARWRKWRGLFFSHSLVLRSTNKGVKEMMKELKAFMVVAFASLLFSFDGVAVTLSGEYSISTNITDNGSNSYTFDYYVTNTNQSVNTGIQPVGLDGFSVLIPDTATISNILNPPNYTNIWAGPPSMWINDFQTVNSNRFIQWWGIQWNSVYPEGTTAHFGFTAENVLLGTADATVTTFWNANPVGPPAVLAANGAYYTEYTAELIGPVAIPFSQVPEPSTLLLFAAGLGGVSFLRRRKRE